MGGGGGGGKLYWYFAITGSRNFEVFWKMFNFFNMNIRKKKIITLMRRKTAWGNFFPSKF